VKPQSNNPADTVDSEELDELTILRQMLDRRYHELVSGKVQPVPGDEVFARLRAKSAARKLDDQATLIAGVERGIKQANRSETMSHEEVLQRVSQTPKS